MPEDAVLKKYALFVLTLCLAGCTKSGLPQAPTPSSSPPVVAPGAPLSLTTYDGGDFHIGVPAGWVQVAKDQPLSKSTNRCSFRLAGSDGTATATLVVTSASSPGAKLADQFELLKATTVQQGETITAESRTEAGDPFGLRSTSSSDAGTLVNYRFVAIGGQNLYLIGLSCKQGGPVTDAQALQIIESFEVP
jgi:hypothetical protein